MIKIVLLYINTYSQIHHKYIDKKKMIDKKIDF